MNNKHNVLLKIWDDNQEEIRKKSLFQVLPLAGNGKLRNNSETSNEFRIFLNEIPSDLIQKYLNECINDAFTESGLALQDIVNQLGKRLGFTVTEGCYNGTKNNINNDGLWVSKEGWSVVVEVKTTDAFSIDLNKIAKYRAELIQNGKIDKNNSSILLIVGRQDTDGLEAQVRGSKHAWDIRLISVDALVRLMLLKEKIEDPKIISKICNILKPREYTRVDDIIDLVFSTTEEAINDYSELPEEEDNISKPKVTPVNFNDLCIQKIEKHLKQNLVKYTKATYKSTDGHYAVLCSVSKEYIRSNNAAYWFAFHPHQDQILENINNSYVAFGCGSEKEIILIPHKEFKNWLDGMNITEKEDGRYYWHVHIFKEKDKYIMHRKSDSEKIDLTKYLI